MGQSGRTDGRPLEKEGSLSGGFFRKVAGECAGALAGIELRKCVESLRICIDRRWSLARRRGAFQGDCKTNGPRWREDDVWNAAHPSEDAFQDVVCPELGVYLCNVDTSRWRQATTTPTTPTCLG